MSKLNFEIANQDNEWQTQQGRGIAPTMTLRRFAMPCRFSPQAPKTRPALRLSGAKNLHFAVAPFPRFSASEFKPDRHPESQN